MSLRYVRDEDGELRSRMWWFRLWKWQHNWRCAECRRAHHG